MGVIRGDPVKRRCPETGDAQGVGDVPNLVGRGVLRVARVVVAVHAVPDLEEALAHHGGEVLGGDSPFVVGMVHVNEGRSAGALTGLGHAVQSLLDDLRHGGAFQRRQGLM